MTEFKFYHPIQIRYGDIDAQGHVNNAKFVTFIEFARFQYLVELGLWDGSDFLGLGLIVADTHISYLKPIKLIDQIQVGVRVARIGKKSMVFTYQIESTNHQLVYAVAETVMVSFDYRRECTVPVPVQWREICSIYEGDDFNIPANP